MNDDLKRRLSVWQVPGPRSDLAEGIVVKAVGHKQAVPFAFRISCSLERAFEEWRYGFLYKAAGFAMIACMGIYTGLLSVPPENAAHVDIVDLALGYDEWSGL